MKNLMILTSVALAFAAPAYARPGNGHGHGNGGGDRAYGYDDNHGRGSLYGYGQGGCPPGLAKKNNGCLPPGQARKMFNVGQRFGGYGTRYGYRQIPYDLRQRYDLNPADRYYYGNGYLYRVDPKTMLVEQVLSALVR